MQLEKRRQVYRVGNRQLEVVDRSITMLEPVDALVSSDDNYLSHGGGVSQALWLAAGTELGGWVEENRHPLSLGMVFRSPAFDLRAEHLFHAISIDFDEHRRIGPREAAALFGAVFDQAVASGCATIALPLLGTGAGRFDASAAAVALVDSFMERAPLQNSLQRVIVCALGPDFERCCRIFEARLRPVPPLAGLVEQVATMAPGSLGSPLREAWQAVETAQEEDLDLALPLFFEICFNHFVFHAWRLDGTPVEGPPALPRLFNEALRHYERADVLVPPRLISACRRGIDGRNQLAHAAGNLELNGAARRAIAGAAEEILSFLTELDQGSARDQPLRLRVEQPPAPTLRARAIPSPGPQQRPSFPAGRTVQEGGTSHVRRLREFLSEMLDEDSLAELHRRLALEGYQGPPEMRLLEFCVNLPDPQAFLASEFSRGALRRALKERAGVELAGGADAATHAEALLDFLGFPIRRQFHGLSSALRETRRCQRLVQTAQGREPITGAVTEAAKYLEFVTLVLLRFVCQAAFHSPADTFFREKKLLAATLELDRCSLGTLLDLLEHLGKLLQNDADRHVALFQRNFHTRGLAPEQSRQITQLRNAQTHWMEGGPKPLEEVRTRALEFFVAALAFLEHLGAPDGRVFPHVVVIEAIEIDRWGRRRIFARDESGEEERIFTDTTVRPGELYYMHPLTNPLRVDPILVPAGEQEEILRRRVADPHV